MDLGGEQGTGAAAEETRNDDAAPTGGEAVEVKEEEINDVDNDGVETLNGLRCLTLSGCVRLTDASIVSVAQRCHRLADVDLSVSICCESYFLHKKYYFSFTADSTTCRTRLLF